MIRLLPISTLFPYTTLFRSHAGMGSGNYISSRTIVCRCEGVHDHRSIRRHESDAARSLSDGRVDASRSEEHTSELQSHSDLVCRLLLEKKKKKTEKKNNKQK